MPSPFALPTQALDWLVPAPEMKVLTLAGTALPRALAAQGHHVFAVDKNPAVVARLRDSGIVAVAAQAESLPFDPCQFDAVVTHQSFHRFAPGLVLSEMARVLRPGGAASVSMLARDDSVPWVKRLIARVRELDPRAMRGDFGLDAVDGLLTSKYFPEHEATSYRHWVPTTKPELLDMVARLPAARGLDEPERDQLLADVTALYDNAAPSGRDALRLPYRLHCWRAWVDHVELTAPIDIDDDGLIIPL
ncbi:class I SAM-dependent methyltransferase [Aestuariimicrobium soli]|uniref:class I SAM-dependent methyltransferase n=1 Tax=Aestuariimicrobium soli TaxID=2035834 RepID=UPI003EB80011